MKYLAIIILTFSTTYCFAVDQKLANGEKAYVAAVESLKEVEFRIESEYRSLKYWLNELDKDKTDHFSSNHDRKFDQDKIDETNKQIQNLEAQYDLAKEAVKKYEPLKLEYDKQVEIEFKRDKFKTAILNVSGMLGLPLTFFCFLIWLNIYQCKKYKRLLQEGKITQDEYDNMMRCNKSHAFDDERTNPATGLRMIGGVDSGGNPSGCSFRSNSTFDYSQDYRDRHRWE